MKSFYEDKKVVVTGGSGFIGTHLVQALLPTGAKIRVPTHRREMIVKDRSIELVKADLSSQEECRKAVRGAECVFHAAGAVSAAGVTTGSNPMSAITANLNLTAQVLEACWAEKVDRVLIFGSSTGYPVTDHPVKEDEMWSGPTHSSYFGYGWMRRYLEKMSEFVNSKSSTKVSIVRPTATYGPYDDFDPATSHVIPARIREAVEKKNPYVVWGTGNETRDFLYIEDLARGCLLMLEKKADADPVNIGYGGETTVRELVQSILKATEHTSCDLQFDATKPVTIPRRVVDVSKAAALLGFKPQVTLEEGIRRTVEWFLENRRD